MPVKSNKSHKRKQNSTITTPENAQTSQEKEISNKRTRTSSSEEETPIGTIIQVEVLNKSSWVWEFFRQELHKKEGGWVKYTICKIEVLVGEECGRAYQIGSSTGNLIGHLSAEHGVTKTNPHPKKVFTHFNNFTKNKLLFSIFSKFILKILANTNNSSKFWQVCSTSWRKKTARIT